MKTGGKLFVGLTLAAAVAATAVLSGGSADGFKKKLIDFTEKADHLIEGTETIGKCTGEDNKGLEIVINKDTIEFEDESYGKSVYEQLNKLTENKQEVIAVAHKDVVSSNDIFDNEVYVSYYFANAKLPDGRQIDAPNLEGNEVNLDKEFTNSDGKEYKLQGFDSEHPEIPVYVEYDSKTNEAVVKYGGSEISD